jgi:hypothetical protein
VGVLGASCIVPQPGRAPPVRSMSVLRGRKCFSCHSTSRRQVLGPAFSACSPALPDAAVRPCKVLARSGGCHRNGRRGGTLCGAEQNSHETQKFSSPARFHYDRHRACTHTASANGPEGVWLIEGEAAVQIFDCRGLLCGRILGCTPRTILSDNSNATRETPIQRCGSANYAG